MCWRNVDRSHGSYLSFEISLWNTSQIWDHLVVNESVAHLTKSFLEWNVVDFEDLSGSIVFEGLLEKSVQLGRAEALILGSTCIFEWKSLVHILDLHSNFIPLSLLV